MEDVAIVERDYLLARLVWVPLTRRQLLLLGVIKCAWPSKLTLPILLTSTLEQPSPPWA